MVVDQDGCSLRWLLRDGYSLIILGESYIRINITYQYKPFGDKQIKYVGRGPCLECLSSLGKSSASLGMYVSNLWRGMASGMSITCM